MTFKSTLSETESPIETEFLWALRTVGDDDVQFVEHANHEDMYRRALKDETQRLVFVASQVVVGNYRCDFMLSTYHGVVPKVMAIECDGYAYHRAHGWQVQRDSERDAYFRRRLIEVRRIAGGKIMRDPYRCARSALEALGSHRQRPEAEWEGLAGGLKRSIPTIFDRWAREYE